MQIQEEPIFSEYKPRRASDDIANEIKKAILEKKFRQGDQLPSEPGLAAQFQVSRLTIREALRLLESKGLITIRKGSRGGVFIQSASKEQIADIIMDKLQLDGIKKEHVTETRVILERGIVKCAVQNAASEDFEKIERHLNEFKESMKSDPDEVPGRTLSQILEFHQLLSEATHIPPLIIFHRTIKTWAERKLVYWLPTRKEKKDQYTSHKRIFEAIKARDGNTAQDLMEEHIRKTMANWD
jgi:DNA-binding FadR family transcriptional regulator